MFGIPGTWGTVGEVRNDIDFETEVQPKLIGEVSNPLNFSKFEFIRLVAGIPGRAITPPAPPSFFPGWVLSDMFFLTEARAELQRRAGGSFVQNLDQNYSLAPAEKAYLMGLGIPGAVIDGWLAQMNTRRNIQAAPNARNYVAHNNDYNGKLKHPVLTMHTEFDPLILVSNESAYSDLVQSTQRKICCQTYNGNGHCAFTGPQVLIGGCYRFVGAHWSRPPAAYFVGAGLLPGFVPPPMLQPELLKIWCRFQI